MNALPSLMSRIALFFRPIAAPLRGLRPVTLPAGELWRRIQDETNLDAAFSWLLENRDDAHPNNDVWDVRRNWPSVKAELRFRLWRGEYVFQPTRMVEVRNADGQTERREIFCAQDRLMIRAIAQVLQPLLSAHLSANCVHLAGHGGLKQAVRDTQDYIAAHPDSFIIKSDVKSYYASIDHLILAEQLRVLLPNERQLHRVLWNFMRRACEFGGDYTDIEKGLPLGASLSPLLGAVYLSPLDELGASVKNGFYRRYMDDWVLVLPKRHALRETLKQQYTVLDALRVQAHPDKTFIGKVAKGFDFLGFHCCPTGVRVSDTALLRRDKKLQRLYEQGASKQRIAKYLAMWLGWAMLAGAGMAQGDTTVLDTDSWEESTSTSTTPYIYISDVVANGTWVNFVSPNYDNPFNDNLDFVLYLPCGNALCEGDGPAGDPVKIAIKNSTGVPVNVTEISCTGSVIEGIGTTVGTIKLREDGDNCSLYVRWDNSGNALTFSGATLSRASGNYTISAGAVIKGEDAGGTAEPSPNSVVVPQPVSASIFDSSHSTVIFSKEIEVTE